MDTEEGFERPSTQTLQNELYLGSGGGFLRQSVRQRQRAGTRRTQAQLSLPALLCVAWRTRQMVSPPLRGEDILATPHPGVTKSSFCLSLSFARRREKQVSRLGGFSSGYDCVPPAWEQNSLS